MMASCKTIRQYLDCKSGNYFVTQRTLSCPRGLPRGARFHEIFLLPLSFRIFFCVGSTFHYRCHRVKAKPPNTLFSTFHDLGAERCSCMVPLIWHTPIIVGSPRWGPGHGQSFRPAPSLYLINLINPVLGIFHPHPEVSYLQECNSLFMCSKSQQT